MDDTDKIKTHGEYFLQDGLKKILNQNILAKFPSFAKVKFLETIEFSPELIAELDKINTDNFIFSTEEYSDGESHEKEYNDWKENYLEESSYTDEYCLKNEMEWDKDFADHNHWKLQNDATVDDLLGEL